ncbi:MAG: nucleotide exchange factor GrpE [Desulfobacterales bacterium]|nr:MAG: nucleotide exchange factor GrpE [Desulfobacterales bacterium]
MSAKKTIKIQTDSDSEALDKKETAAEAVGNENQEPDIEPEKAEEDQAQDPIKELEEKLTSKEREAQENYDRLLRVSAEFENYKKRTSREMEEFRKYSNQSLIKEMLSVVDNLELAMNSTDGQKTIDKGLLEGLEMTHKEILKVFEKFNVTPISAQGQTFDPTFHEAVMQEETDDVPENTVVNELQKGYLIHDRLLRPAMVVVAKSKSKKDNNDPQANPDQ